MGCEQDRFVLAANPDASWMARAVPRGEANGLRLVVPASGWRCLTSRSRITVCCVATPGFSGQKPSTSAEAMYTMWSSRAATR